MLFLLILVKISQTILENNSSEIFLFSLVKPIMHGGLNSSVNPLTTIDGYIHMLGAWDSHLDVDIRIQSLITVFKCLAQGSVVTELPEHD